MAEEIKKKSLCCSTEQLNAMYQAWNTHKNDKISHISEQERNTWNAKADTAYVDEKTEGKASQAAFESHTGNGDIHVTADERRTWNSKATPADVQEVDSRVDTLEGGLESLGADIQGLSKSLTATQNQLALYAAPLQDGSIEGAWMKYAEYSFPLKANYETTDAVFTVRNRVLSATAEKGRLCARLRYAKGTASFQVAQLVWESKMGIDVSKFVLCVNAAQNKVELYVSCSTVYSGYIIIPEEMGTNQNPVDFSAWTLYSPTAGQTELPTEADGWETVVSE